jgi:ribosomal protein S18 acetylase RimI-like enzyme
MQPLLRPAEASDAERVAEVLIESRRAFLPFAPSAHTDAEVRRWVRDVLLPSAKTTVAVIGGVVVGVIAVSTKEGLGWVEQLYIHPTHVGQGIGSKLLTHVIATTPGPIRLYTFQQNVRSRRFYERHGFMAVEFTDGTANEEGCPDVLYELAVSPQAV